MKRYLAILTLLITSLTLSGYPTIYNNINNARIPYEEIIGLVAKDLGLDTLDFKLYISPSIAFDNMTGGVSQGPGGISLIVNDGSTREESICIFIHELVHVSQLVTKRLLIRRNGQWFNGVKINMGQPDYLLPQEIEAIEITDILLNRYKKELKALIKKQKS